MPRIQHVSLEIGDDLIADEIRFWELLGFARVDPPEGIGGSSVWMQAGEQQVHLLPVPEPQLPASGHLALIADDFEATVEAVREAGFEVVPGAEYWGSPRAKATGPSGHLVELMESAPA